ncbi:MULTISPECIES: metal ABC transporter permease [Micrococcus]|uniref:Metal ABC transporter permease n=1 Tax=Micrococcus lylae TaxID=1273 RepID=A0ABY2K466_9MICC|nr:MULTISPECIES: metal ABC transporter permease [Micrococcus]TFI01477.1 metal ABC transporter permease [Micrococcus lylae]
MEWLTAPFELGFQQRALMGGLIAAVMCSVVGTWLVLRGMSFFGDAFVHGVMPGIATAVLLGGNVYVGAAVAAVVMLAGISLVHRATTLKEDTAIGLLFVGMMALGVVIISMSDSYTGSLTSILFGDALGVSVEHLWIQGGIAAAVVLLALLLYRPLLTLSFSEAKARSLGMCPQLTHVLLLVMIGAAVIGSFQAVGTVLVFGLLVGPPATAALVTRTVPAMMFTAMVLGAFSVTLGLILSFHWNTAASATMALVPIVLFFVVLTVQAVLRRGRGRGRRAGRRVAGDAVLTPAVEPTVKEPTA